MKLQYCSDLHLEMPANAAYVKKYPLKPEGEVLILAGDILPFTLQKTETEFIDYLADHFEQVYWVPGNHEYFGSDAAAVANPLLEKLRSNVWLVNNQVVEYNNVHFICTTLWSRIEVIHAWDIERSVTDFRNITWAGERFTASEFNQLHSQSIAFLEKAFKELSAENRIVVTHHVPTLQNYPNRYRNSPVNGAFVTELFDLIHDSGARYWIYGHHHYNIPAFIIGNTTMLTNQLGYVQRGENNWFERGKVVEVNT